MYRGHTVAVVVPAYEEEGFVGEVLETVPAFVDRVYAVDDRSPDGTWSEIQVAADRVNRDWQAPEAVTDGGTDARRRIVPIRHEENKGVGGAIKTGYEHAYADGMDVVAVMNGDGQMDPDVLDRILDPIVDGDAEYVKGNRLLHPEDRDGMSGFRFFGNAVLSLLTKFAAGYWKLTDPQNGYTAISREAIGKLDLDDLYDEYGFCNHVLVHLNARSMRVADVSIPAIYGDEESNIEYSTFVPSLSWLLLRSFLWRLKVRYLVFDFHPLVLFYAAGTLGLAGGLAGFAGAAYLFATGAGGFLTSAVSLVAFLVGAVALAGGMLLDMYENEGLEVRRYEYRGSETNPSPAGGQGRVESGD